jgi:hypothetical protein
MVPGATVLVAGGEYAGGASAGGGLRVGKVVVGLDSMVDWFWLAEEDAEFDFFEPKRLKGLILLIPDMLSVRDEVAHRVLCCKSNVEAILIAGEASPGLGW